MSSGRFEIVKCCEGCRNGGWTSRRANNSVDKT